MDGNKLRVDAIGVHHYGGPNFAGFKAKMKTIHDKFHRPLIITEMAVVDWTAKDKTPADNKHTPEAVLRFMKQVLPWMEEQDWILGYWDMHGSPLTSADMWVRVPPCSTKTTR